MITTQVSTVKENEKEEGETAISEFFNNYEYERVNSGITMSTGASAATLKSAPLRQSNAVRHAISANSQPILVASTPYSQEENGLKMLQEDKFSYSLHPALGAEPFYPDETLGGTVENLVIAHYVYRSGYGEDDSGPYVLWQGSDDNGNIWGTGGENYAIYFVDWQEPAQPIPNDYPSMNFRGWEQATGDTMFTGTCVEGNFWIEGDSGNHWTNGGTVNTLNVVGDVTVNTSFAGSVWDFSDDGWSDCIAADNAGAYYADTEWCWGMNSQVMDTTYTYPEMEDPSYQTQGCFTHWQGTEENGSAWISWYEEIGMARTTNVDIDENAGWYINESYGTIDYAGYAVYDPINTTTSTHVIAIRAYDWEQAGPFNLITVEGAVYENLYLYPGEVGIDYKNPNIAAGNGNLIVMTEVIQGANHSIEVLATQDGDPENLETVLTLYNATHATDILYPEIKHIGGDSFLMHITVDNELLMFVTHDGGLTWDGPYKRSGDETVIEEYRNACISDGGRQSVWEWDNGSIYTSPTDIKYQLYYGHNMFGLTGYCTYEYGDPAAPVYAEVTNKNTSTTFIAEVDTDGSRYNRNLLGGIDVWVYDSLGNPVDLPFMVYAEDETALYNYTNFTFSPPISNVTEVDVAMDQGEPQNPPNPVLAPDPETGVGFKKCRYISIIPNTNPGMQTAIRVTLVNVDLFEEFNGEVRWVGTPREVSELSGETGSNPQDSWMAPLSCEAVYRDWSDVTGPAGDALHVYGTEICPNSEYDVDVRFEELDLFSTALNRVTSIWGDVCGADGWDTPPEGAVDFTDIPAVVAKFKNAPGAPIKARCDLGPNLVDQKIDFTDIPNCVDGFRGLLFDYSYTGPTGC
jgi:hypothetical protein